MREILVKNISSNDKSRRLFSLRERTSHEGVSFGTQKKCFYVIKRYKHFSTEQGLENWATGSNELSSQAQPSIFIRRKCDSNLRQQRFDCKVRGNFFAAWRRDIFYVTYILSININMEPEIPQHIS